MNARDSLLVALPAAILGAGVGYLLATVLGGGSGQLGASEAVARSGAPPAALSATSGVVAPNAAPAAPTRAPAQVRPPEEVANVAESELAPALNAIDPPHVEVLKGAGAITGRVLDETGAPLAGAVIISTRRTLSSPAADPSAVGAAAPPTHSLEDYLRQQAQSWASGRAALERALSAADGNYRIDGLREESAYSLSAYLEGYEVEPERSAYQVLPGQELSFRARQVHEVPVALVFANGGSPVEGEVSVERGNSIDRYLWTPEAPVLRLVSGRVALRGYAGVLPGRARRGQVDSSHGSEEVGLDVVDNAGAPVTLLLEPRLGIRGRIIDSWGGAGRFQVRLLRLPPGGAFDEEALAESNQNTSSNDGQYQFLDLAAGLYAVGLTTYEPPLIAHALVEVADGVAELDLRVPEPDADQHLLVRVFGPSGRVLEDVNFSFEHAHRGGSSSRGLQSRRDPEGAYWIQPSGRFEDFFEAWPSGTTYTLTARHAELGSREVQLEVGQREVNVQFEEPIAIAVEVAGYVGSGYEGRLSVTVQRVEEEGDEQGSRGRFNGWGWGGGDGELSAEGVARFDGLEPGTWRVNLLLGDQGWRNQAIGSAEVQVLSGERPVTLEIPVLHDLVVHAPGLSEGTWLSLQRADEPDEFAFMGGESAELGADDRATFEGLQAGQYRLTANGTASELEVSIPCGEVYFEAREPDCLKVAIGDMEGLLYQSGLRAGDLIIGVNGEEFESVGELWQTLRGGGGELPLMVLRGADQLDFTLPASATGPDFYEKLGGMLTPTSRP